MNGSAKAHGSCSVHFQPFCNTAALFSEEEVLFKSMDAGIRTILLPTYESGNAVANPHF